ncbi:MAG: exopolyphosphatase [Lachnospiraceae bacterium]|nr:exopolyphosphatase [Lachnospiraceae bacterium]
MRTFAAIDVGSYELTMKIYEISARGRMKEIDCIRHSIELGTDTYNTGKISLQRVDELCEVLREFRTIMETYQVDAYQAYGTSAIRETENNMIVLDLIKNRTGITVEVISNSEQRFLDYKSLATKAEEFRQIIKQSTAILNIGGGSIQLSLFDKDTLITTQNMRLGVLRLRDRLRTLQSRTNHYAELIAEIANPQLVLFKKMYLKNREIKNLILMDDYVSYLMQNEAITHETPGYLSGEEFLRIVGSLKEIPLSDFMKSMNISVEKADLFYHSAVLIKNMIEVMDAETLWAPGVCLCDGIAYEYAQKEKLLKPQHDFDKDILACAADMGRRYMCSNKRSDVLENISLSIFDAMKRVHGMSKRERLLLQLAAKLNDCGKYISLMNVGECSYNIIMSTEIIGLSHLEREMVANIVKYNRIPITYDADAGGGPMLDQESFLKVAKLTAILRLATGLDRSHRQKFRNIKAVLKDDELIITVDTADDITLEKGLIGKKAGFFEEVFSVKTVIKQKRRF